MHVPTISHHERHMTSASTTSASQARRRSGTWRPATSCGLQLITSSGAPDRAARLRQVRQSSIPFRTVEEEVLGLHVRRSRPSPADAACRALATWSSTGHGCQEPTRYETARTTRSPSRRHSPAASYRVDASALVERQRPPAARSRRRAWRHVARACRGARRHPVLVVEPGARLLHRHRPARRPQLGDHRVDRETRAR